MRKGIWMLPKDTQADINKMDNAEFKQLRHRFKGVLRFKATEPGYHEEIAKAAKEILAKREGQGVQA